MYLYLFNFFEDPEWIKAATTRRNERHQRAMLWFQTFFETCGDQIPNSPGHIHLDLTTKESIYKLYEHDMWMEYYPSHCMDQYSSSYRNFDDLELVTFEVWKNMWRFHFPDCKIRRYKQVTGKCWTCYAINSGRTKAGVGQLGVLYKKLFAMHRGGLFMLERKEYKRRVHKAISPENRGKVSIFKTVIVDKVLTLCVLNKVLSFIIDGMDQNHCRIPQTGPDLAYPGEPVTQHITGVLEHGVGLFVYRNFDNLSKGSNLTIYCILSQIERFFNEHEKFPEEIYIQLDGGSENADRCVLGFLELIVARRMAKKVYFTRLPVGHTHEDIDACFGYISIYIVLYTMYYILDYHLSF
jgi:hypothetical protein